MTFDRTIFIAVAVIIIILLVVFLVIPEYKTFKSLQLNLGEKKAEFNAKYDYYASIAKTYYDLQSRQDDIKKIDDALPQNSVLGGLVYFLQKTVKENGMLAKSLFLSQSSPGGGGASFNQSQSSGVKDITFSMSLVGDYTSLEKFITALEKSSRIFEVTNISFGSLSGQSSVVTQSSGQNQSQFQIQQTYNFSLQVKTHSY